MHRLAVSFGSEETIGAVRDMSKLDATSSKASDLFSKAAERRVKVKHGRSRTGKSGSERSRECPSRLRLLAFRLR